MNLKYLVLLLEWSSSKENKTKTNFKWCISNKYIGRVKINHIDDYEYSSTFILIFI